MKQIIKDVLDDISNSQINLASEAARNMVSGLISAALKTKGSYKEYTKYELDEQEARKDWVCSICGKSTFDVGVDYIGSGTNHLGCELEIEMGNKNDDSDIPEGIKRAKELSQQALDEGARSLQKQLYTEMTSDGLPEGGDTQAVLESHKLADEIVDNQEGLKRAKKLSRGAMKDGTRREKNWSQKNHEVKVFDDNDADVELRNKIFDLQKLNFWHKK